MAIERVDSIYDLQALTAEHEKYLAILKESKAAIIELNGIRVTAKSSSLSELTKSTQELDKAINKTNSTTQLGIKENARLQESIKAVNGVINQRFASEAKLATVTTDYNKQTIANRTETARLNKEIKNGVEAEQAAVGSRDRARAQIKILTAEKDKLSLINADEAKQYDVLVAKLEKYENFLKKTGSSAEKQRANIGNYPQVGNFSEAFGVLSKELDEVRAKLKTALDPASLKKFEQEEKLLTQLTENLGKAFKSPTQELKAFTNAAKEIGQQFGLGSKAFTDFAAQVGEKKDELADIQNTINFSASDTKYLDGIVSAVNGLAGAYGVAQSAQELFGDGTEDTQKAMLKLQAVLTLVTSLQTILNTVQNDNAAIQTALAVKTGVLNAARAVQAAISGALVASTQAEVAAVTEQVIASEAAAVAIGEQAIATEAGVVANVELAATAEAGAVAMAGETVATEAATVATSTFATTLIATGIGAIIVAIAAGVVYLVTKIQDWNAATASSAKANADLAKSLGDLVSATREYEAIRSQSAANELKDLQNTIDRRKAAGVTAGQSLALDKQIAAEKLKTANQDAALYNITSGTVKKAMQDAQSFADLVRLTERQKRDYINQTTESQDKNYTRNIEVFDDLIAKQKEQANSTKAIFDFANETYQRQADTQAQIDNIATQEAKLNADERRKFVLESTRIEADAITSKNALVLSDERSTLAQRLTALKSNAAAQRAVAQAQLNDTLNDPTKSGVDKTIAQKQFSAESIKITNDTNRAIFDTEEAARKRRLAAELDTNKTLLEADKEFQERIIDNQFGALQDRTNAAQKAADDQEQIITDEYLHTIATTVLTNEELIALNTAYNTKLAQLDYDTAERMRSIQEKYTADYIAYIKQRQQAATDEQTNLSNISNDATATDIINDAAGQIAKASGQKRIDLQKQLQHELSQADSNGALDRLKITESELQQQLGAAMLIEAPTTDIEARITENKRKQAALRQGITDEEYEYNKAKRDKELDQAQRFGDAILDLGQTLGDARIDREKNELQVQQDNLDKQTQQEIEAVNASTRSEADKAAAITIIQARAQQQREQIDAKQRKLDYEKAKFDKEIAILQVTAQIAIAAAKKDFATAALAGIALIKLIATPLPKYRTGRGYGKEELAYTGDGGVSEYIMRQDGSIEKTPAVETLTHLMPKDRVLKNKSELMRELALTTMPVIGGGRENGTEKAIHKMGARIEDAVNSIKIHSTTITKEGWRTQNQRLRDYDKWVNQNIKN